MGHNSPPSHPKPLVHPNGRKLTSKELRKGLQEHLDFYNERLKDLEDHKPIIFGRWKWEEEVNRVRRAIEDIEFKIFSQDMPEVIKELNNIFHGGAI